MCPGCRAFLRDVESPIRGLDVRMMFARAQTEDVLMSIFSDFHVYSGSNAASAPPKVRKIGPRDCFAALSEGFDDFLAMPSHLVFLGLFYVLAGLVLSSLSSFGGALQLLFPLASGFALVGPVVPL